jgi:hypothetical protein
VSIEEFEPMSDPSTRWPRRLIVQVVLCAACAALAVLTAFVPDWIERLLGMPPESGPDGGSGELEWGIVLLFAAGSLASGWWARRGWLRWSRARAVRQTAR